MNSKEHNAHVDGLMRDIINQYDNIVPGDLGDQSPDPIEDKAERGAKQLIKHIEEMMTKNHSTLFGRAYHHRFKELLLDEITELIMSYERGDE